MRDSFLPSVLTNMKAGNKNSTGHFRQTTNIISILTPRNFRLLLIHENYDGSPMHAGSFRKQRMLCIPQIHHGLMGLLTGSVEYLCYNVIMPMKCNLSQTCPSNHTYINTCANTYTRTCTCPHTNWAHTYCTTCTCVCALSLSFSLSHTHNVRASE